MKQARRSIGGARRGIWIASYLVIAAHLAYSAGARAQATSASVPGPVPVPVPAAPLTSTATEVPAAAQAFATGTCPVERPAILFNRWQEDWSVLHDACVPHQALDGLKYIPLGGDPNSYLSLGANLRERLESNNAPMFGVGANPSNTYLIQRSEFSLDSHFAQHVQVFVQLEDARAFGKDNVTPVDKDTLDLEQAFVAYVDTIGDGTVKFRVGRQEMAFDLQRFISVRDGPNVRQAYDGLWADYETGPWRFIGYATQPVQYRDQSTFDDMSSDHLTFSGVRFERKDVGPGDLSGYYSLYGRDDAHFLSVVGDEHRNVFDLRYVGKSGAVDWDVESMLQTGHFGNQSILAWALGVLTGYTLDMPGSPRIGLQFDAASGDHNPNDGRLQTFNPMFPNGYYFTQAAYTGYANLIHLKPSITIKPSSRLTLLGAVGFQWRETTHDAVYAQGPMAVPGTAGVGNAWTGAYLQLRTDYAITPELVSSIEAVHFQVGNTIRQAGGSNADYVGVELKYGW